jgi:hypothetical protein
LRRAFFVRLCTGIHSGSRPQFFPLCRVSRSIRPRRPPRSRFACASREIKFGCFEAIEHTGNRPPPTFAAFALALSLPPPPTHPLSRNNSLEHSSTYRHPSSPHIRTRRCSASPDVTLTRSHSPIPRSHSPDSTLSILYPRSFVVISVLHSAPWSLRMHKIWARRAHARSLGSLNEHFKTRTDHKKVDPKGRLPCQISIHYKGSIRCKSTISLVQTLGSGLNLKIGPFGHWCLKESTCPCVESSSASLVAWRRRNYAKNQTWSVDARQSIANGLSWHAPCA